MWVVICILCSLFTYFAVTQSQFRRTTSSSNCFVPSNSLGVAYETKHETICAIYCNLRAADFFKWNNGICELFSDGITDASVGSTFAKNSSTSSFSTVEVGAKKPTIASPHYMLSVPNNVNDGNWSTNYHSADNSSYFRPYIVIDLQGQQLISKIRILPCADTDYIGKRFVDIQVLVGNSYPTGNFSTYRLIKTIPGPAPVGDNWMEIDVNPPACGRYVGLYKYVSHDYDKYFLIVEELEVYTNIYG